MKYYKVDKERPFLNPFGRKCTKSYPRYLWEKSITYGGIAFAVGAPQCSRMVDVH